MNAHFHLNILYGVLYCLGRGSVSITYLINSDVSLQSQRPLIICRVVLRLNAYEGMVKFQNSISLAQENLRNNMSDNTTTNLQKGSDALISISEAIEKLHKISGASSLHSEYKLIDSWMSNKALIELCLLAVAGFYTWISNV